MMKVIRPTGLPASAQYWIRLRAGSSSRLKAFVLVAGCLAVGVSAIAGMSGSAFAAGSEGISASRAEQALALQTRVAETKLGRRVMDALGDAYAGVWFASAPAPAKFHVGVTSAESSRAVGRLAAQAGLAADVVATPVRSTWAELTAAQEEWNRRLAKPLAIGDATTGIEPAQNAVSIILSSSVYPSERVTLKDDAAKEKVNVVIRVEPSPKLDWRKLASCEEPFAVNRARCEETLVSGVGWSCSHRANAICDVREAEPVGTQCSAGPMLIEGGETYMLTAGHCFGVSGSGSLTVQTLAEYPRGGGLLEIGREVKWYETRPRDFAEVKIIPRRAGEGFAVETATPVPALVAEWRRSARTPHAVEGVEEAMRGQEVCKEGMTSGETCGVVLEVDVRTPLEEHAFVSDACGEGGDSGGPVYIRGTYLMLGITVSGERRCGEAGTKTNYHPLLGFRGAEEFGILETFAPQRLLTRANETRPRTFLLAEWLVNGVAVTSELSTQTSGEFSLEDSKTAFGKAKILCSGILDGWVGANSLGWVSEILNLSGEAISTTPLTGLALECTSQEGCESSTKPKVWPVGLGWETEVELMEEGSAFFALLSLPHAGGANPGWEMECLVLGITSVDECTGSEGVSELALEGTTLLDKRSRAFTELSEVKLMTCSQGGEGSGVIEGEFSVSLNGGGELTASSEGSVS